MILKLQLLVFALFGLFSVLNAQDTDRRVLTVDVNGGLSQSDFFEFSPTAGFQLRVRPRDRWIVGLSADLFWFENLIGFSGGPIQTNVEYKSGYSLGLVSGFDFISAGKFRMNAVAGPTLSQTRGTVTTIRFFGESSTSEVRDFSSNTSVGVGLWLRSAYDLTARLYVLGELSYHRDLADDYDRGSLRLGLGLKL